MSYKPLKSKKDDTSNLDLSSIENKGVDKEAMAMHLASQLGSSTEGTTNTSTGVAGGAASGAAAGAQIGGTEGAIIGGVLGGITGGLKAHQAKKQKKMQAEVDRLQTLDNINSNKTAKNNAILSGLANRLSSTLV